METIRSKQTQTSFLNTLGVSSEQWEELIRILNKAWTTQVERNRRRSERHTCGRITAALLRVDHPGGGKADFIVRTRDISKSGIGLLHGSFLHVNTQVTVLLLLPDHRVLQLRGHVARCNYLLHMVHEIGVLFDEPLDLQALGLESGPAAPRAAG